MSGGHGHVDHSGNKGVALLISVLALVLAFPQIAMWLPEALEDAPGLAAPAAPDSDTGARETLEAGDTVKSE